MIYEKRFNGSLLTIARKARSLNQADLCTGDLKQGHISKFENGMAQPSGEQVSVISDKLKFPISFFFQEWQPIGLPLSVHPNTMYRKKSALATKALHTVEAMENIVVMHVKTLVESIHITAKRELPFLDIDDYGSPERVAETLRAFWNIPSGPIDNLTKLLEEAGILVIEVGFLDEGFDGMTVRRGGLPPMIFVSDKAPADRIRTTLGHELGHLVMHSMPHPDMESEAFDFAGAFLMPKREIAPRLRGSIRLAHLGRLKLEWKVAMQAIIMRGYSIGSISTHQKKLLFINMSKKGYRRHEPPEFDFPKEAAFLFPELLRQHSTELGYSLDEISEILHINKDDLCRWYGLCDQQVEGSEKKRLLRIVR